MYLEKKGHAKMDEPARINPAELHELIEHTLKQAKSLGADQAAVSMRSEYGFAVSARAGAVDTLEHQQEKILSITIYDQQRSGAASTTDLSKQAIQTTIEKAVSIAKYTQADQYAGLADAELLAYDYPDLQLHHHWDIDPSRAIELAIDCESIARDQDACINDSEGADVSSYDYYKAYGNSHGFVGGFRASEQYIGCCVVAEKNGEKQRDFEYSIARRPDQLEDVSLIAKRAAEKTLKRLGARQLKTCKTPVIFYAPLAKSLLSNFVGAISGGALYRQSTFLLDHLDQPIFPDHVHIYQEPHLLSAMGSRPFDAEGVKNADRDYVVDGILKSYCLGSYSARRLGTTTTGNAGGVRNLAISHSEHNLQALMKEMGTGLLVTDLIGSGVRLLTGDYSRGASGFWIENGEIQYPVEEITIAGNLKDMFKGIVAVGNDLDCRSNIRTGSIWVNQMTVAGQ